jgi:transposase
LVLEQKLSRAKVAEQLSLSTSTLVNWVKAYNTGKLEEIGKSHRLLTEIEVELARVKKENATLKMECEILKKAAAYFARESLPGTWQ